MEDVPSLRADDQDILGRRENGPRHAHTERLEQFETEAGWVALVELDRCGGYEDDVLVPKNPMETHDVVIVLLER